MSIFEGAVSGLSGVANKLGFNFLTGNIPLVPPAPIYVGLQVPELNNGIGSTGPANHTGVFFLIFLIILQSLVTLQYRWRKKHL